jgi:hypothetical protein
LSAAARAATAPYLPVREWVADVLPRLRGADAPLQCTQRAGELVFVPAGWVHATLNLDEAVGVGAQYSWSYDDHLAVAAAALRANAADFHSHKDLGLSHRAKALERRRDGSRWPGLAAHRAAAERELRAALRLLPSDLQLYGAAGADRPIPRLLYAPP